MKNELLAKYILGEANTKEEQKVGQWLEESEDHQREFQQIKRRFTIENTMDVLITIVLQALMTSTIAVATT